MIHEMYSWQHCPVPGRAWAFLALALVALVAQGRAADDLSGSLNTLRSVKKLGEGNVAASHAWRQIASASAAQIPVILEALDGANAIAANWLRAAVDSIAERSLSQGQSLPADALERFLKDARHGSASRRLAFEWLARVDAQAPERLIPGMLDDPELEFRRAAVERLIALADAKHASANAAEATAIYRQAFEKSRDIDQVKQLAAKLKELQIPVDLPKHLGLLTRWKLIGPFDNTDLSGFDIAYPPENQFDPRARYDGKRGQVGWIDHQTDEEFGMVDLNKALGKANGVVGYAAFEFNAPRAGPVDIRLGSGNAHKLWLNGKPISESKAYHSGENLDQFIGKGELRAGRNLILLKLLQNEQKESWAQDWHFQLRVCDAIGTAVLPVDQSATKTIETAATDS